MNLGQLQTQLARLIGLDSTDNDPNVAAWATDALNQAQHEIAVDLQIPRSSVLLPSVSGPVSLPSNVQSWGVLAVFDATNHNPLAIIDEAKGYAEGAPTAITGTPTIAVYSHSANTLTPHPIPSSPIDLYVHYAFIPPDMTSSTDEPWAGQYRDHHYIVALKAALLIHESDWADPKRVEWVMSRYSLRLQRLRQRIEAQKDAKPRSEVEIHDLPRA